MISAIIHREKEVYSITVFSAMLYMLFCIDVCSENKHPKLSFHQNQLEV